LSTQKNSFTFENTNKSSKKSFKMSGVNKVILVGHLGKDPEVRTLESGAKVATFSLATTETYRNKEGQKVEQTEWHNIVVWRGLAEVVEKYLKKGKEVYIEGRIRNRSYEKDGQKRYISEINADNMVMLGKKDQAHSDNHQAVPEPPELEQPGITEDLPF
jgi:single-strand DNA-binding protein